MPQRQNLLIIIFASFIVILSACNGSQSTENLADPPPATKAPVAAEALTELPQEPQLPKPSGMSAEAQRVEFQAEDGHNLVGYYYPSSYANAPIIVLMHMAGSDQNSWTRVGLQQWLQNRLSENPIPANQAHIYPKLPNELSFAVFAFDFRNFGESDPMPGLAFNSGELVLDAKAAYATASLLPGVDAQSMAGIGSSIGSDGVVNGCASGCLGALSLSPGSYLGVPYPEAVTALDQENKPAWCIAAEGDNASASTCQSASGNNYKMLIYPGNNHGTRFLKEPDIPEDIGQVILDWLLLVFNKNS